MEKISLISTAEGLHPTEKPNRNDLLVKLLAVFMFSSLTLAGFFAFQTQKLSNELTNMRSQITLSSTSSVSKDPTSEWKTYSNPQNKFTFKYPTLFTVINYKSWMYDAVKLTFRQNLQEVDTTEIPNNIIPKQKIEMSTPSNMDGILFSAVEITDTSSTAEQYVKDIYNTAVKDKLSTVTISPIKEMIISGKKAYYFEKTNSYTIKDIFVDLDKNTILRIEQNYNDKLFDQILTTFEFTQ